MKRKSIPYYIFLSVLLVTLLLLVALAVFLPFYQPALPTAGGVTDTAVISESEPEEPKPNPLARRTPDTNPTTGAYLPYESNAVPDYDYYKELIAARKEAGYEPKSEPSTDNRMIYLTFDDGPSKFTPDVLNILREKNAKATFFVIWNSIPSQQQYYQQIIEEGHELAIHTFSHSYQTVYASVDAYFTDFFKMYDFLWDLTGRSITSFRFPGGSSNAICDSEIKTGIMEKASELGLVYYDWNIDSGDALSKQVPAEQLINTVVTTAKANGVVLMHDAGVKETTVKALPGMIDKLREEGYSFGTISATRENPCQHKKLNTPVE